MTISYDDVQNILKIIDSSALEEVHLELGDFKLVVRRHGAPGTTPQVETPTPPARAAGAPPARRRPRRRAPSGAARRRPTASR